MATKGAVSLVEGYWPTAVSRYVQVPGLNVSEAVVARPARRRAGHAALVGRETLSYEALSEAVERAAAALRALSADAPRVAVAIDGQIDALSVFLASLRIGSTILLLDPRSSPEDRSAHLRAFRPDVLVSDLASAAESAPAPSTWRTMLPEDLLRAAEGEAVPQPRIDLRAPAVALAGADGRLVYHSHGGLLSWAVSFSAFVPLTESAVVLSGAPISSWGGLVSALAALFRGGTCVLEPTRMVLEEGLVPDGVALGGGETYAVAPYGTLTTIAGTASARRRPLADAGVNGIFATVEGAFPVGGRRSIESALGTPVMTVFGSAAAGPVIASHPSWYLAEAAGIPITNIDLWPLDPSTGEPLLVPWEAIEFAELGVRSPLTAIAYETPEDQERRVHSGWLRLDMVATMDPNGLFYLRA